MVYGILSNPTENFNYVSAGHPGPVHLPFSKDPVILESAGFPLGLTDGAFQERTIYLGPGDRLYLYSDGVPKAMNAGKQWGNVQLLQAIRLRRNQPLQNSVTSLLAELVTWQQSEKPQDDVSIVAIEIPTKAL